jgi:hypothetical protein
MMPFGTISHFLNKELGLVNKLTHWVSKLLSLGMMRCSKAFIMLIHKLLWTILGDTIILDESAI